MGMCSGLGFCWVGPFRFLIDDPERLVSGNAFT